MLWFKKKKSKEESELTLTESAIISLLKDSENLTTEEVTKEIDKLNLGCSDEPIHYLNRLEKKEIVESEFSKERKNIIWRLSKKVKVNG